MFSSVLWNNNSTICIGGTLTNSSKLNNDKLQDKNKSLAHLE